MVPKNATKRFFQKFWSCNSHTSSQNHNLDISLSSTWKATEKTTTDPITTLPPRCSSTCDLILSPFYRYHNNSGPLSPPDDFKILILVFYHHQQPQYYDNKSSTMIVSITFPLENKNCPNLYSISSSVASEHISPTIKYSMRLRNTPLICQYI